MFKSLNFLANYSCMYVGHKNLKGLVFDYLGRLVF